MTTPFRVHDQLCFALYDASRAMVGQYRVGLDRLGITYPQYLVLLRLWETGPQRVSELGLALHLDSGTLSPLLTRLEKQGLVVRRRSTADERVVVIELTEAGAALKEPARQVQAEAEEATGLEPAELGELRRTLADLAARLRGEDQPLERTA